MIAPGTLIRPNGCDGKRGDVAGRRIRYDRKVLPQRLLSVQLAISRFPGPITPDRIGQADGFNDKDRS